ncbi:hypothetical protein ACFYNZ_17240 [Streptomyces kebangsaanensis]|uniref:SH3 domain-containing protein n=1 Tax=Streptomyces kebangsaanensis TaxID=864058 RepID=A0ABW6KWA9_9ACTN
MGFTATPAQAAIDPATPNAVACYLYVDKAIGYYNVRTATNPTAQLIVKYTGTRLPVWSACGEIVGTTYRCTSTSPQDNSWVAVNYNGRQGYVAAGCAGGLGA